MLTVRVPPQEIVPLLSYQRSLKAFAGDEVEEVAVEVDVEDVLN